MKTIFDKNEVYKSSDIAKALFKEFPYAYKDFQSVMGTVRYYARHNGHNPINPEQTENYLYTGETAQRIYEDARQNAYYNRNRYEITGNDSDRFVNLTRDEVNDLYARLSAIIHKGEKPETIYKYMAQGCRVDVQAVKEWFNSCCFDAEHLKSIQGYADGTLRLSTEREGGFIPKNKINAQMSIDEVEPTSTDANVTTTTITTTTTSPVQKGNDMMRFYTIRKKFNEDLNQLLSTATTPEEKIAIYNMFSSVYEGVMNTPHEANQTLDPIINGYEIDKTTER